MFRQLYKFAKIHIRLLSTKSEATLTAQHDIDTNILTEDSESLKPEGWDAALPFDAIPGPKGIPLLGNLWRFFPYIGNFYDPMNDHVEFLKRVQKYGDISVLRGIGKDIVFIYDPDDIEKSFRNEGAWPIRFSLPSLTYYRKVVRPDIFRGMGTLATTNGKEWADIRSIVNSIMLQPRAVDAYIPITDEVANDFLAKIRYMKKQTGSDEMPEDFANEIYKWALESVGSVALDKRLGCLANDLPYESETYKVVDSVQMFFQLMVHFDMRPSYWKYYSSKKWKRYVEILDVITTVFYKYINEARERYQHSPTNGQKSMLQMLLEADERIAIPIAIDLLTAGVDTTGKTVSSTLYFLALNKASQERLREELKALLPEKDSKVTKQTLKKTRYLKAVVKESLRLAPIAISGKRTMTKDIILKGYQIPKGTEVVQCINFVTMWSEKQFPRPREFIPERWLREENTGELSHKHAHPFGFLPFGFGPRSCIGKRIALMEIETVLAKVIRNFDVSWPHPPAKFVARPFYSIDGPLKFSFKEI